MCECVRLAYHFMDGAIESIIFREDEENDEGHIDVMGVPLLDVVEDLQDWHHLRCAGRREGGG